MASTPTFTSGDTDAADVAGLIARTAATADAWMQGDIDAYLELTHYASGFTLTAPSGGAPEQFADRRTELAGWQSPFADGESTLEITAAHVWGDAAVLVMIERQHGRIGELPDQDWSLRVTAVFRRTEDGWDMVHRHADPLVRPASMQQLQALAGE